MSKNALKVRETLTSRTSINLPPNMKELLDEIALSNGRSLSSEIVIRLRQSLDMPPSTKRPAVTRNRKDGKTISKK